MSDTPVTIYNKPVDSPVNQDNSSAVFPFNSDNKAVDQPSESDNSRIDSPAEPDNKASDPATEMSDQSDLPDTEEGGTKKKRSARKDRSMNTYSLEGFFSLPLDRQIELATKYGYSSTEFEASDLFQFAYSVFIKSLSEHGFERSYVYTGPSNEAASSGDDMKRIYIDHGKRGETIEKKVTLSATTNEKLNRLLDSPEHPLSNSERSKALDAILSSALDGFLSLKEQGKFRLAYRPQEEEWLI